MKSLRAIIDCHLNRMWLPGQNQWMALNKDDDEVLLSNVREILGLNCENTENNQMSIQHTAETIYYKPGFILYVVVQKAYFKLTQIRELYPWIQILK